MKRSVALPVVAVALTALFGSLPRPAAGQVCKGEGPQVGRWKTWVLSSGSEIPVPAPPADDSAQTKAELAELRQLQTQRSDITNTAIQYWNRDPATRRWTELTLSLAPFGLTNARIHAIVHTAMYDAVVASYAAKYAYNRRPPSQLAPDLKPVVPFANEPGSNLPSYPSEHAAVAAAAAGTLAYLFPKDADSFAAMAKEAGESRLQAGLNYRSDVAAGFALGQAVAQKAIARAAADGSDAPWTGTIPTGPGLWTGDKPAVPQAAMWKSWLLASNSQFRPGPPPKFGSPEFQADLEEVKRINANPTPSQRAIALFWISPSLGYWQQIAYDLMDRNRLGTPCAARILALITVSWIDAYIATWDAKFTYWRLRPDQADPSIKPVFVDPGHPSYPAAGSAVSWSLAEPLAYFFPEDSPRLRGLAEEASLSRLFGGIHFRSDVEAGAQLARRVVELAVQRDAMNEH
jgi:membrane-associated phospholipid phosphatase